MENAKPIKPIVNPGPSKELWDDALKRSGLDPEKVIEYNVPEGQEPRRAVTIEEMNEAIAQAGASAGRITRDDD